MPDETAQPTPEVTIQPVTKESLASLIEIDVGSVTDEMVAEANAVPFEDGEEVVAVGGSLPATAPEGDKKVEWKDPEGWDQHYYKKADVEAVDPYAVLKDEKHVLHPVVKRIYGDPLRDENHPFHKQALENRQATSKAMQEKADAERRAVELEQQVKEYQTQSISGVLNDPAQKMYGGITPESIELGEHTWADWFEERDKYNTAISQRKSEAAAEAAALNDFRSEITKQKTELAPKYPGVNFDTVIQKFSPITEDGRVNEAYVPLTLAEAVIVETVLRGNGGFDKLKESLIEQGRNEIREQVKKGGIDLSPKPALKLGNTDGSAPPAPASPLKPVESPAEIYSMSQEEFDRRAKAGEFGDISVPSLY